MAITDIVPEPSEVGPCDPKDFVSAIKYGGAVSSGEVPDQERNPSDFKIRTETGTLSLTDIPMNRFGMSMARRFRGDESAYRTFMWRWMALGAITADPEAPDEFFRGEGREREMHPAIAHAAAVVPLRDKLQFDPPEFWDQVRVIAKELEEQESNQ
jgi:hypothetical protein